MKDLEERETSTYTRQASSSTTAAVTETVPTTVPTTVAPVTDSVTSSVASSLEGRFLSGDKKNEITFNADGTVELKIKRDDFSGVYQVTGSKLLIVYIDGGKSISEEYDFVLNGNILTLTSSKGEASVYIKQ